MVKIGSARIDENGRAMGGVAGDQTGKEVATENWYLHPYGWTLIRAKTHEMRERLARDMEYACKNPLIGYDQSQNQTLWQEAKWCAYDCSKISKPCETDCARLVRVCAWYAGSKPRDFYTATEMSALKATGDFNVYTSAKYTKSSDYLLRGDILVTPRQGHTVIVLTNGAKVSGEQDGQVQTSQPAKNFSKDVAGTYQTTAAANLRFGAGTNQKVMTVLDSGSIVNCYGYYTQGVGRKWLYVATNKHGTRYIGFMSDRMLKKLY